MNVSAISIESGVISVKHQRQQYNQRRLWRAHEIKRKQAESGNLSENQSSVSSHQQQAAETWRNISDEEKGERVMAIPAWLKKKKKTWRIVCDEISSTYQQRLSEKRKAWQSAKSISK